MLRLRHAIERASRRRWLGLLVLLCLGLLLVLLVFHTLEEGTLEDSALACLAVVLVAVVTLGASDAPARRGQLRPPRRGPPGIAALVVTPIGGDLRAGATPLRL